MGGGNKNSRVRCSVLSLFATGDQIVDDMCYFSARWRFLKTWHVSELILGTSKGVSHRHLGIRVLAGQIERSIGGRNLRLK